MKRPGEDWLLGPLFYSISLVVMIVGPVWFFAHNEAASYRKFCDKPVTTWDAVFLDLRIDECD